MSVGGTRCSDCSSALPCVQLVQDLDHSPTKRMQTGATNRKLQFVIGVGLGLLVCLLGVLCLAPRHRELELRAVTVVAGGTNYLHVSITNTSSRVVVVNATWELDLGGVLVWQVKSGTVVTDTGSNPKYTIRVAPGYGADRFYAIPPEASSVEISFEYRVRGWVSNARQLLIDHGHREWATKLSALYRFFPEEREAKRVFQL